MCLLSTVHKTYRTITVGIKYTKYVEKMRIRVYKRNDIYIHDVNTPPAGNAAFLYCCYKLVSRLRWVRRRKYQYVHSFVGMEHRMLNIPRPVHYYTTMIKVVECRKQELSWSLDSKPTGDRIINPAVGCHYLPPGHPPVTFLTMV